jgi:hypothetical protein
MKSMMDVSPAKIALALCVAVLSPAFCSVAQTPEETSTIIITPVNGVANTFQLIRVYPDKVEVRREGIRLNFSRDSIKRARNPQAEAIMGEADQTLSRIEQENLAEFPQLLEQMERHLPRVQSIAQQFDWLIPEASDTYHEIQQSVWDLRDTLRANEALEKVASDLERMVSGLQPLSATWEESVATAMAEAERIPYLGIRQSVIDRLSKIRRSIRLDLAEKVGGNIARIRRLGQELLDLREKGELTEERWTLSQREMERAAGLIPDQKAREEINEYIEGVLSKTETAIAEEREKRRIAEIEQAMENFRLALSSGKVVPGDAEQDPMFQEIVAKVETIASPEARSHLEAGVASLREDVAGLVAQASQVVSATSPFAAPVSPGQPPLPTAPVAPQAPSAPGPLGWLEDLLGSLYAAIAAGLLGFLVLILLVGWLVGRKNRKKNAAVAQTEMGDYDIFSLSEEVETEHQPVAYSIKPEAKKEEDVFGFSSGTAPVEESVEEASDVTDDPFSFDEAEEVSRRPGESSVQPATQYEDLLPKASEDDIFGFSSLAEEEPGWDESVTSPPQEEEEPTDSAEIDPYSFLADNEPETEDEDGEEQPRTYQIEDDVFSFGDMGTEEEEDELPGQTLEEEDSASAIPEPRRESLPDDIFGDSEEEGDKRDPFGFGASFSGSNKGSEEDPLDFGSSAGEEDRDSGGDDLFALEDDNEEEDDDDDPFGLKKS